MPDVDHILIAACHNAEVNLKLRIRRVYCLELFNALAIPSKARLWAFRKLVVVIMLECGGCNDQIPHAHRRIQSTCRACANDEIEFLMIQYMLGLNPELGLAMPTERKGQIDLRKTMDVQPANFLGVGFYVESRKTLIETI